jgi:cytochrome c oxidase subunit II
MKQLVIFLIAATGGYLQQQSVVRSTAHETGNNEQVIRISASTFEFNPSEITVRKGVPVVLELTSQDRHHGFKLSAFELRVDIKPGAVEKVRFVPDKIGNFTFLCDVFCGDGHEEMSGTIKVVEQ